MNWIYIVVVLIILIVIGFNTKTFRCFCKSGFVKAIASIMVGILTILGIFIGIFSDTLKQHEDRYVYDNLYWFNSKNIINFPIEELKYTLQDEEDTVLVLKTDAIDIQGFEESVHYVFVVDKTLDSEKKPNKDKEKIEDLRDLLKQRLEQYDQLGTYNRIWLNTYNFKDREDLILAGCILKILLENIQENKKNTYQVFVYNGEHTAGCWRSHYDQRIKNKIYDGYEFEIIENLDTLNNDLFDFFLKYSLHNRYREDRICRNSNFKRIVDTITNSLKANPSVKNKKKVITIISDLVHEEKTADFKDVETSISNLSSIPHVSISKKDTKYNKEVKTVLNLVDLEYKNKDNTAMHDAVKDLFHKYFHFCHHYNYHELGILGDTFSQYNHLVNIATFPHKDNKKDTARTLITFRYPFMSGKFNELYSTYLKFKQEGNFIMSINDNSVVPCDFVMKLTPCTKTKHSTTTDETDEDCLILKKNNTKHFYIDSTITYMAQFDADKLSKNMEWSFFYQDGNKTIKENVTITFVTKMPKTLCYIMILMITIFYVLLLTLTIYFSFKLLICRRITIQKRLWSSIFVSISAILLVIILGNLIGNYVKELCNIEKSFLVCYILLTVTIIVLLIILIVHEVRYKIVLHDNNGTANYRLLQCPYNQNVIFPSIAATPDNTVLILVSLTTIAMFLSFIISLIIFTS